jgi:molybdopterin synthase sulfur carrier subunit
LARISLSFLLKPFAQGEKDVQVPGTTVSEVIESLERRFPGAGAALRREGRLAPGVTVVVDGKMPPAGMEAPVEPDSEIHFLPIIGGG